jgi:thioesterase domain-containing protein/acyl carrier protein
MVLAETNTSLAAAQETAQFLEHLYSLDVKLSVEGDRLQVDAPRGRLSSELAQEIGRRKSEIQAYLDAQHRLAVIQPQYASGSFPLSIGQQAVWSAAQLAPGSPVFNMYLVFHLTGDLDIPALEGALRFLVERHIPLRSRVWSANGETRLEACSVETWSLAAASGDSDWIKRQIERDIRQPFDLSRDFLLRAGLYRQSDDLYTLSLVMHHLASDGWSWAVFLEELGRVYAAFSQGRTSDLPPLPVQYPDYAAWQRTWVESPPGLKQLADWQLALAGAAPLLLSEHQASAQGGYSGQRITRLTPAELGERARRLGRQQGTTLFNTLLTAFGLALHARTGQDDLLVLAPAAGRTLPETHSLVGYFNNLLPLRLVLSASTSGLSALRQVNRTTQEAFERQAVPFSQLAALPELRRLPLTQVVFALQEAGSRSLALPGLAVVPVEVYNGAANFPFSMSVEERNEGLLLTAEWREGGLDARQAAVLLEAFEQALEHLTAKPDAPFSILPENMGQAQYPAPDYAVHEGRPVEYAPPATPVEQTLVPLWEQALGVSPVGLHDNFFELGGHSLLALRLFVRIEQELGVNLPLSVLLKDPTPAYLAQLIEGRADPVSWDCLVPIQPRGWRRPFFGVHGVLGNVLFWRRLAQKLGNDQPFYGLQAPGLDGLSDPPASIPELARRYLAEIRHVQPHGPYALGGYSLGGEIAFEMAQQLVASGEEVALLVLFDTSNPQRPANPPRALPKAAPGPVSKEKRHPPTSRWQTWQRKIARHVQRMQQKSFMENVDYLRVEARQRWARFSALTAAVPYRLLKRRLPDRLLVEYLSQRLVMALDRYSPQVYPGKITLFRARQTLDSNPLDDPQGWAPLAAGGLDVHLFDSTHNLLSREFVDAVGDELLECLSQEVEG